MVTHTNTNKKKKKRGVINMKNKKQKKRVKSEKGVVRNGCCFWFVVGLCSVLGCVVSAGGREGGGGGGEGEGGK